MRVVLSLFLVTMLAAISVLAQTGETVITDQPQNSNMVETPTFEAVEVSQAPQPMTNTGLLLSPGAVPPGSSDSPAAPEPAPMSTGAKVGIVAGIVVVVLGVLIAIGISNQG
jgi:hypothetical protein